MNRGTVHTRVQLVLVWALLLAGMRDASVSLSCTFRQPLTAACVCSEAIIL